ncbi:MAG: DNA-directed RNA polymerase subunit F [Theionarchaea archaeon]|nr:DNA-directed RNA polymerase subunit F [Theionarchaea archaeon]MBU7037317.1 DNA-directed RNA polymerase subunit F [Theionarchaea archaeon]
MDGKQIEKSEPVTLAEVRAILSSRREAGDLLYEQSIALDHANKFARLDIEKAHKLVEELVESGVRKDMACKLADLLPQSKEELQMLFPKERFISDEPLIEKIISTIQKYGES